MRQIKKWILIKLLAYIYINSNKKKFNSILKKKSYVIIIFFLFYYCVTEFKVLNLIRTERGLFNNNNKKIKMVVKLNDLFSYKATTKKIIISIRSLCIYIYVAIWSSYSSKFMLIIYKTRIYIKWINAIKCMNKNINKIASFNFFYIIFANF